MIVENYRKILNNVEILKIVKNRIYIFNTFQYFDIFRQFSITIKIMSNIIFIIIIIILV